MATVRRAFGYTARRVTCHFCMSTSRKLTTLLDILRCICGDILIICHGRFVNMCVCMCVCLYVRDYLHVLMLCTEY